MRCYLKIDFETFWIGDLQFSIALLNYQRVYKMIIIHELEIPSKQTRSRDLLLVELWYRFWNPPYRVLLPDAPWGQAWFNLLPLRKNFFLDAWPWWTSSCASWIRWTSTRPAKNKDLYRICKKNWPRCSQDPTPSIWSGWTPFLTFTERLYR